jgi:NAD(P)-dependent dehydrogenase (short-subunit alcohol dehydrogenase family)
MANMSSKMGSIDDNGSGGIYLYCSSKAALNMVCVSAAKDLAPREIKVAILHPGWVRTDMGGENGELSVTESAQQLRRNLSQMTMADSGRFMDIDGSTIPW